MIKGFVLKADIRDASANSGKVTFKRNDYTKREIAAMPFFVNKMYLDYQKGTQTYPYITKEQAAKYPEYFNFK